MNIKNKFGIKKYMVCENNKSANPVFFDSEKLAAEYCLKIKCDTFFEIDDAEAINSFSSRDFSISIKKMYFVDPALLKFGMIPNREI